MMRLGAKTMVAVMTAGLVSMGAVAKAEGPRAGDLMVRLEGTVVAPAEDVKSVKLNGTAIADADANVTNSIIPTLSLTYFFSKNLAVETICCFTPHGVDGRRSLQGFGGTGELIDKAWILPATVTLQYHFDSMGGFKPYVGAGVSWFYFFNEKAGSGAKAAGFNSVEIDSAFGLALQAGVDISLGGGWYWNVDVKKVFLNTDATWKDGAGNRIVADVDLDPWIISTGIGIKFNLFDRHHEPLK